MKKFGKVLFVAASLAAIAGGAFYYIKKVVKKDTDDDFDDFEDEFDDFELDDEEPMDSSAAENREYVTINLEVTEQETSTQEKPVVNDKKEEIKEETKEETSKEASKETSQKTSKSKTSDYKKEKEEKTIES